MRHVDYVFPAYVCMFIGTITQKVVYLNDICHVALVHLIVCKFLTLIWMWILSGLSWMWNSKLTVWF